jgi:hypothetical protein
MRQLLDVNVLIALLDADHSLHARARGWFVKQAREGWASCPLTQNGCVRIMSHSAYPNAVAVSDVAARLRDAASNRLHEFWADDLSLLDVQVADVSRIHGPRQITDVYLLALAVRRGGALATFDGSISVNAVRGFGKRNLSVI